MALVHRRLLEEALQRPAGDRAVVAPRVLPGATGTPVQAVREAFEERRRLAGQDLRRQLVGISPAAVRVDDDRGT